MDKYNLFESKILKDEEERDNEFFENLQLMKEDKITKRIKELQEDSRFTFKLTDDVIALVYRTAVEDLSKEKKDPDKVYKDEEVITTSSKELNKKFAHRKNIIHQQKS